MAPGSTKQVCPPNHCLVIVGASPSAHSNVAMEAAVELVTYGKTIMDRARCIFLGAKCVHVFVAA